MIPDDADHADQEFTGWLAAYDDALAAGQTPAPEADRSLTPEQRECWRGTLPLLHQLQHLWPRSDSSLPEDEAPENEPFVLGRASGQLGRFRIVRELGRGGCGVVFLAHDPTLGRQVALKVPQPEVMVSAEMRQRFVREARAAAGLDHPNIVAIHETGEIGPVAYIASAYCDGPTLAAWLKQRADPVPADDAAALLVVLADAVQHAHDRNILHRDLKPGNILLPAAGGRPAAPGPGPEPTADRQQLTAARIADFGLAKFIEEQRHDLSLGDESGSATPFEAVPTRTGALLGTPRYMAPEQAESRKEVGPAADVWALGVILYEVLAGRPPFQGANDLATLQLVVHEEPVSPRRLRPDVPRDLETICLKCLQKEPRQRYASAGKLVQSLKLYQEGKPIPDRPTGRVERTRKWARRRPAAAALVAVSALALFALIAGAGWHVVQMEKHNTELKQVNAELKKTNAELRDREWRLRQNFYASQFKSAARAREMGQPVQVVEILGDLRPGQGEDDLRGFEWHYLRGLCHPLHTVWRGHQKSVLHLAVSPDGRTIASTGDDRIVRLWDVITGKPREVYQGRWPRIEALRYTVDGRTLLMLSTGPDGVCLWDAASGEVRASFTTLGACHRPMAIAPDGRAVARSPSQGLVLCDPITGKHMVVCPDEVMLSVAFSPDGRTLAIAYADGSVHLRDALTGELRFVLQGHTAWVRPLAFSPDGRTLASAGHLAGEPASVGEVLLWDVPTGALLATVDQHLGEVLSLAFVSKSRLLALACVDGSVKLLDTGPAPETEPLLGGACKQAWSVAFAPDGRTLALAGEPHLVQLWDLSAGRERALLKGHESLVTCVAFAPDGRTIASASFDSKVKLWDAVTGQLQATLIGAADRLRCVTFSPDGRLVAAGGRDGTVRLWDVQVGRIGNPSYVPLTSLEGHDRTVRAVAFAPDGRTLASGSEDGTVRLWDTATWELRGRLEDIDEVSCLAFSPDGLTLATGNTQGAARLWDLAARRERAVLRGHVKYIHALAFSPDGRTLATAGEDRTVRLWHAATGGELLKLEEHAARVNAVAFAPDGQLDGTLASADHTGAVLLWRTRSSDPASSPSDDRKGPPFGSDGVVVTVVGPEPAPFAVAVQPDERIVTAGRAGVVDVDSDFVVLRHHGNGALDPTFGREGRVAIDFGETPERGGQYEGAAVVAVQDGKILLGGSSQGRFALARLLADDGRLDRSFGKEGKVLTDLGGRGGGLHHLVLLPGDKILALGAAMFPGTGWDLVLARYDRNGSPDTAFGKEGQVSVNIFGDEEWSAVAVQGDKLLVVGSSARGPRGDGDVDFAAARLRADGSLDRTFGQDGKVRIDFFGNTDKGMAVAVQPGGKVLLAGLVRGPDGFHLGLARLLTEGKPDLSFGTDGKVSVPFSAQLPGMVRMVVQPDRKIVLAGFTGDAANPFALARFTPEGRSDSSFGQGGRIVHPSAGTAGPEFAKGVGAHLGSRACGCGLALQPDGKIVVTALGRLNDKEGFAVARYLPDGRPDGIAAKVPASAPGAR